MSEIKRALGKKIKELRKKVGLTQEGLAEKTGLDYKYLQTIEGKNPPNIKIETVQKLAKALNTTPSHLLSF